MHVGYIPKNVVEIDQLMGTYHSIVLKDETARNDSNLIQYILDKIVNMRFKTPKWSPQVYMGL